MSRFLGYAWIPLIGATAWAATILALLIVWLAQGHPEYVPSDEQTILYISDVAAGHGWQQAIFIVGGSITALFFTASVIVDRILRARGRLPETVRRKERLASNAAILFAILGSLALVILTCFNDQAFPRVHWTCTVLFVIFVALSAISTTIEEACLVRDHPTRRHLRRSTYAKVFVVSFEVLAAIAFGALQVKQTNLYQSVSAILEWTIAIIFVLYLLTFVADLRPAVKTSRGYLERHPEEKANLAGNGISPYDQAERGQPAGFSNYDNGGYGNEGMANQGPAGSSHLEGGYGNGGMANHGPGGMQGGPAQPEMAHVGST